MNNEHDPFDIDQDIGPNGLICTLVVVCVCLSVLLLASVWL